jgi:hypothetical protein
MVRSSKVSLSGRKTRQERSEVVLRYVNRARNRLCAVMKPAELGCQRGERRRPATV